MPTPNPRVSPHFSQTIDDYVTAFEAALEHASTPLRHSEVDALLEELSWLDSHGSAALLAALGTPEAAANKIYVREIAADKVRMRKAVVTTAVSAGTIWIVVTVFRRFLHTD